MSSRLLWIVFAVSVVLLFSRNSNAETVCTQYGSSVAVEDLGGYGPACAGTGPGCNECVTTASRGVKICYWTTLNDIYCFFGGQYPDNQI